MAVNLRTVVAELDVGQLRGLARARRLDEKRCQLKEEERRLARKLRSVTARSERLDRSIQRILRRYKSKGRGRRGRKRGSTKRRSNLRFPLMVVQAFKGTGKGNLRAGQVADWISKKHPRLAKMLDLRARVAQTLARNRKRFKRVKKGLYALKNGVAA